MKPPPPGWPRISTSLCYPDAAKAIDWLCTAFGFEIQLKIEGEGGRIEHSELRYGDGMIMVGDSKPGKFPKRRSPKEADGINTQNMMVYVDDVEAHCKQARDAGGIIVAEPTTTDYGEDYWEDRGYEVEDVGGHRWWFIQRLRNPQSQSQGQTQTKTTNA
ncbi:MAG: Glyoxalase family protein [Myxococcaceae bacterium]|nr:Glyoxalase family protein [Myxococcaceae bacterium]